MATRGVSAGGRPTARWRRSISQRSAVVEPGRRHVTNVQLEPGDYVTTGKGVMALVDSATLRVEGYFEETKLPKIHAGDRVRCG